MLVRRVIQVLMVVSAFALTSGAQEQPKKDHPARCLSADVTGFGKEMYTNIAPSAMARR
jgi:hypothetical protein